MVAGSQHASNRAPRRGLCARLAMITLLALAPVSIGAGCSAVEDVIDPVTTPAEVPETVEAAQAMRAKGHKGWSHREARAVYIQQVARLEGLDAGWVREGLSAEQRARRAYAWRKQARLMTRAMMRDQASVAELEARDMAKYGTKHGPTWDFLVQKARDAGKTGDDVYLSIVASAQTTNAGLNRMLGL